MKFAFIAEKAGELRVVALCAALGLASFRVRRVGQSDDRGHKLRPRPNVLLRFDLEVNLFAQRLSMKWRVDLTSTGKVWPDFCFDLKTPVPQEGSMVPACCDLAQLKQLQIGLADEGCVILCREPKQSCLVPLHEQDIDSLRNQCLANCLRIDRVGRNHRTWQIVGQLKNKLKRMVYHKAVTKPLARWIVCS